jgi:uncharacterized protein (TIGR02147 family)
MYPSINIYHYTDYREYLKAYFTQRKKIDPKFSHRYLSRRLGLDSPNFIMLVMQGKRNLTQQMAFRISGEFKHNPKETEYFENMAGFAKAETTSEKDLYFNRMMAIRKAMNVDKIDEHQYKYYSNWYNIAIRELVTYQEFKGDYKWLAKKVIPRITESQAKRSVELLIKLGLIQKKGNVYTRKSALISTGPQVSSLAIANFHRTMAQRAADAIDLIPKQERDMSACTVNISQKGFEQIRETIAECQRKVMAIAEADSPADRVYQVNFHLFPISAKGKNILNE